jgi:hypothetical protein
MNSFRKAILDSLADDETSVPNELVSAARLAEPTDSVRPSASKCACWLAD